MTEIHRPWFAIDLDDIEQNRLSYVHLDVTSQEDLAAGFPSGILLSANRFAHGANLHLSWDQARTLRDALSQLMQEAGHE